jgi:LPS-assembly protein
MFIADPRCDLTYWRLLMPPAVDNLTQHIAFDTLVPRAFPRARLALQIAAQCAGALLLFGLSFTAAQAESVNVAKARELDWVPLEELTEAQKRRLPVACCGAYVAPPRDDAEADLDPEKASLFGTANKSEAEKQTKITLTEDVRLTQGRRSIRADRFYLDKETREAELTGNIQVREPGVLMRADKAYINIDAGDARLEQARFVLYETRVHGSAASLNKFGDSIISLDQGSFTGCEPGDNTWSIEGANITLHNDKHYGTARHMRLHIKDVPVLYAPYFRFPVGPDRLSGFLFPSIGLSPDNGLTEFSLPFYWNIAPNYDATLTPRYLAEHGYLLESELRHKAISFDTKLSGSALRNDTGGSSEKLKRQIDSGAITEAEAYPYRGQDRWQFNVAQTGGRNQPWSTRIDYTDVSDTDYIRDIDRGAVDINREAYIRQMAMANYTSSNWSLGAKTEEFRLLTNGQLPYRELPRLYANGGYQLGDWQLELNHEYTNFDTNRYFEGDRANLITGERLRTHYGVLWDNEYQAGFIKPGLAVKTLGYRLASPNLSAAVEPNPAFVAPQASLDMGLYFEREQQVFGSDFTQTLEPRAFYLYRDYESQDSLYGLSSPQSYVNFDTSDLKFTYQQLVRDSRFSGGDRLDDANHLAYGVSSRWVEQTSGIERVRMSLGQIIYAEDRNVSILNDDSDYANTRTSSALVGQLNGQIGESLRFSNDLLFDYQKSRLDGLSSSLHYMDENYRIVNLGYRYSRDPVSLIALDTAPVVAPTLNQVDISTIWPIAPQWALIARANYDFNYNAELDAFAGFEYNDCCYRVRLLARRWVDFDFSPDFLENLGSEDYDRGIFIEVQLKGFGSLSQRISSLLDKAVLGFNKREESLH